MPGQGGLGGDVETGDLYEPILAYFLHIVTVKACLEMIYSSESPSI